MNALHVMNAAGQLKPELAREIKGQLTATLNWHAARLNLDGVDVALRVLPWALPETGVHGYAPTGTYVELTINPGHGHFLSGWRTELPATLAHELHHAARWRGPGYGRTLLEVLVSEGLAQHHELTERETPPLYAQAPVNLRELWARATPLLRTTDFGFEAWFYGSQVQNLPRWAGYALGFDLVGRALLHLGGAAAEHVHTPADLILAAAHP
ncbi:DUF2268 domain-containing putative Zn-dependent protease [Deinococcus radiotolerans]|uniref:DUF2268 domain-containing protein n=1 Tax=Deinococcus radiotolerans TaxID=1309407 RepID=A0ABQ2FKQ0_9DEIO|nr:DUF2268 domain-containing putative Zn-dependent protease [Deinococcus radiotolerans]GGL07340.1 hypothetical protein GCM10010844_27700 [Deinococcus radiotolerans]